MGLVAGAFLCLLAAGTISAQPGPTTKPPVRLNYQVGPCQGIEVAALDDRRLVVGWTVAEGPSMGVYLCPRTDQLWQPILRITGVDGVQPRDLQLTLIDGAEREEPDQLHAVWTAVEGDVRGLYHARLDGAEAAMPQGRRLVTSAVGDIDFPMIAADSQGGLLIVWQESQSIGFRIHASRLLADGSLEEMGLVSDEELLGMDPQILTTDPPRVAWYEIDEVGRRLCVEEWKPAGKRWRPSAYERQLRGLPEDTSLLLRDTPAGVVACWQEAEDGQSAIALDLPVELTNVEARARPEEILSEPPGDHARPDLSGSLPGRLTLAWQIFTDDRQYLRLASLFSDGRDAEIVALPTDTHRFAALPDHITLANWSAVAWIDDAQDGGSGDVFFTEVNWSY